MNNSRKKIILEIFINEQKYELPFPSIETLDNFTVQFKNDKELTKFLFGTDPVELHWMKIKYSYKKPNTNETVHKYLPIKYNDDYFDELSLRDTLINYLQYHKHELKNNTWPIVHIIRGIHNKNRRQGDFTDGEIMNAGYELWNKGYKTKRDHYFLLKERKVPMIILPMDTYYEKITILKNMLNLQELETDDPYINYLQSYATKGTEEHDYSIEQLSMFDLEELSYMNQTPSTDESIDDIFEHMNQISPQKREALKTELNNLRNEFIKTSGKKRCRK